MITEKKNHAHVLGALTWNQRKEKPPQPASSFTALTTAACSTNDAAAALIPETEPLSSSPAQRLERTAARRSRIAIMWHLHQSRGKAAAEDTDF